MFYSGIILVKRKSIKETFEIDKNKLVYWNFFIDLKGKVKFWFGFYILSEE